MIDDQNEAQSVLNRRRGIVPGEDLSGYSLTDLEERKAVLKEEIARTEAMADNKRAGLSAAESLFRTG